MLDGTGKQLLDLLQRIDADRATYDQLVDDARNAVTEAQAALESLLALEGLCDATTLKTPSGRKRRRDRGKKRVRNGDCNPFTAEGEAVVDDGEFASTPSSESMSSSRSAISFVGNSRESC